MEMFRSCPLMSVTHWQQRVSSHQEGAVSTGQVNLFGLSLSLSYSLLFSATDFSYRLSVSPCFSPYLAVEKKKRQESTSSVLKFATLGRREGNLSISCCRQPPRRCGCSPGTLNAFCPPAFHLPTSHPHRLSESVKCSGETKDVNAAMENRQLKR